MEENTNYFKQLYAIDAGDKKGTKNGLTYIPWATAWGEAKLLFPDATYKIYEEVLAYAPDNYTPMKTRPWFDDGKTAWVKTGVKINGIEHIEMLPIMDFKNKPIPAESVTSMDANKAIQRSITKACARHGLFLYVYEGEELSSDTKEREKLQAECMDQIGKKSKLSEDAKKKVAEYCKAADENANGDPRLIENVEVLKKLKTQLMGIRK